MARNDWLWFALKAYGIYVLSSAVLTLPAVAMAPDRTQGPLALSMFLQGAIGTYLLLDGSHLLQLANRRGPAAGGDDTRGERRR